MRILAAKSLFLLAICLAPGTVATGATVMSQAFAVDTRTVRGDYDQDGLPDFYEQQVGLDWQFDDASKDPDDDGWTNLQEYHAGTDPNSADSTQSGRRASGRFTVNTGGLEATIDSDSDGIPDWWELRYAFAVDTPDSHGDSDLDGKSNLAEYLAGENPRVDDRLVAPLTVSSFFEVDTGGKFRDFDSDGLPNWWEQLFFTNATAALRASDADGDQHSNLDEFLAGTDPMDPASLFAIVEVRPGPLSLIRWSSVSDRTYSLWRINPDSFGMEAVASNLLATPPFNSYTNATPVARELYRVSTP